MTDESSETRDGSQPEPERKVLQFGRRRGAAPAEGGENVVARQLDVHAVQAPTDGLVLACACGGTLHEMLNAGYIRCGRCQRVASTLSWGFKKPGQPL